ncbi:MAG: imelysin family protein [Alphaproteobacteria bacterium]
MRTALIALTAATVAFAALPAAAMDGDRKAVVKTYADIAQAMYADALADARALQAAIADLVAKPSAAGLQAARKAWLAARPSYQQTEVYRFGNAIVDDWEGKVNAWPLDEGLIDYVARSYGVESDENPLYTANVVGHTSIKVGADTVDVSQITPELLAETLHEAGDVEANVATGYHAIEFLLWGQDLNGTGPGAGRRPWTDYARGSACTHGNCDRRAAYLTAATDLLVDDLTWMAAQWVPGGDARKALEAMSPDEGVAVMLTGLGSLSYGELAGERMKLGLLLHDPEEEHDCFSDNTHNSHYYDIQGMRAVWFADYTSRSGAKVSGPSLQSLVAATDLGLARQMRERLDATHAAARAMVDRAENKEAYDQMIGDGNPAGNAVVQAVIDALSEQTRTIESVVAALKLQAIAFEGSDSLDDPSKVFK